MGNKHTPTMSTVTHLAFLVLAVSANQKQIIGGTPEVTFCNTSLTPLIVNGYSLEPNDIHSNENVTLKINSTLSEDVSNGTIHIDAKVRIIPVYDKTLNLCTELAQANMSCPLKKGPYDFEKTLAIPNIPVHGQITATVTINDQNAKQLLCMQIVCKV